MIDVPKKSSDWKMHKKIVTFCLSSNDINLTLCIVDIDASTFMMESTSLS